VSPADGVDVVAFDAWLFDLDGVVTDTAELHAAAWKETFDPVLALEAERTGVPQRPFDPDEDYRRFVDGRSRADGVRTFLASRGIRLDEGLPGDPPSAGTVFGTANRKNERLLGLLAGGGVTACGGAVDLIEVLRTHGVATALVSASENAGAVLAGAGIEALFDARVDGLVVRDLHLAGKPAPDSYLEAARLLGVPPSRAVVVEDALAGVEAGRAGGFGLVVGVDHGGQADALVAHGADVVVGDLAELLP